MVAQEFSEKKKWLIAFSVFTGTLMSTIDTFILYIATPNLRGIFSSTVAEISWISTSYAVSSLIVMLISGWLCCRYGRKNTYQLGLFIFIVSSLLCGMSTSLESLVIARIFQGIGAGILLPVEHVILRRTFPPRQHSIVMGVYGTTVMVGPSLGPILGGYIIDHYHWSFIFYINIPLGIMGLLMVHQYVPKDLDSERNLNSFFDWFGTALLAVGLFFLVWLLERGDRLDWFESISNTVFLFISISCLALFCAHQLTSKNPVVDLRVFSNGIFRATVMLNTLLGFIVTATLFVLPIYMQDVLGYSPTKAGEAMAPRALFMMVLFPLVGRLLVRYNPKYFVIVGLALGIASALLMARFTHETSFNGLLFPQILQGIAVVLVLVPLTTIGLKAVRPEELGSAAGIDSMSRSLGGSLGIAIFASVITFYEQHSWGLVRPHINLSFNVFYKRFGTVVDYFYLAGSSGRSAVDKSIELLSRRVEEQVLVITYMNLFQIISIIFLFMLVFALFLKMQKKP